MKKRTFLVIVIIKFTNMQERNFSASEIAISKLANRFLFPKKIVRWFLGN